jgi:protein dithiol:quinone oxidoreductase
LITNRQINFFAFIFCVGLMTTALYMQHVMELRPCYLCITQRVFVLTTGMLVLLALLHNKGFKIYGSLTIISALGGGYFSVKQLWLQNLPIDQIPACGPPAEYLFNAFKFSEALSMLLQGDGNCATVQWTFLHLSIPGWTLISFLLLAILGLLPIIRKR